MVITLVLLVGYIIDGVEIIQDSILEVNEHCWRDSKLINYFASQPIWTLLGCFMFFASGIMVILTWSSEDYVSTSSSATELEYTRNSRAAMGLGALCIITSLIFLTDFIWVRMFDVVHTFSIISFPDHRRSCVNEARGSLWTMEPRNKILNGKAT